MCKYRDALGQPGKGVHSFRLANIAVVDVLLTVALAYTLSRKFRVAVWKMFLVLLALSLVLHRLLCVETTLTKLVFKS